MAAIVILNIVFAAFVVVGVVSLLSWGIARNRTMADALSARAHAYAHSRHHRPGRPAPARQYGRATGFSA
jgi:hypothetical protein